MPDILCRLYLLRIEHTYYKLDHKKLKGIQDQIKTSDEKRAQAEASTELPEDKKAETESAEEIKEDKKEEGEDKKEGVDEKINDEEVSEKKVEEEVDTEAIQREQDDAEMISQMCKYIYSNATDRIRTRAMLCHIFHHAKHDRWYEARDLMLISHLQENIQHSDIPTQVCYKMSQYF